MAATPTNSSVAEERVRACNSGAPGKALMDSIAGILSAMASDNDDGGFSEDRALFGYAKAARRYGRGIRRAVSASGSCSHDEDVEGNGACGGVSCIGDTDEKPYLARGVFDGGRPRSDSPRGLPVDLPMAGLRKGFRVYVESFEADLAWACLCSWAWSWG